jgi:hypothetical protein
MIDLKCFSGTEILTVSTAVCPPNVIDKFSVSIKVFMLSPPILVDRNKEEGDRKQQV